MIKSVSNNKIVTFKSSEPQRNINIIKYKDCSFPEKTEIKQEATLGAILGGIGGFVLVALPSRLERIEEHLKPQHLKTTKKERLVASILSGLLLSIITSCGFLYMKRQEITNRHASLNMKQ